MTRLLFVGLSRLSNGDATLAAGFARQLPRSKFQFGMVATGEVTAQLREQGMPTLPLDRGSAAANLATLDGIVRDFRPDHLIAADAFSLNRSQSWSGLTMALLRERYQVPVASFDRYEWHSADYVADFYGGRRVRLPRLLDECDLVIRVCPLSRPGPIRPGVVLTPMAGGGLRDAAVPRSGAGQPVQGDHRPLVFLVNSAWEYADVVRYSGVAPLVHAMPRLIHSHLSALGRPLRVIHVGPRAWRFAVDEHIEYHHFQRLPYPMFHEQLAGADLFLTANAASVTLAQAVLAGVPSLLLRNDVVFDLAGAVADGVAPAWLTAAVPQLPVAWPFRVFPLGWYDLLTPLLADNPYADCFHAVGVFERAAVLRELTALLDDAPSRRHLHERQLVFRDLLAGLAPPAEAFLAAVSR